MAFKIGDNVIMHNEGWQTGSTSLKPDWFYNTPGTVITSSSVIEVRNNKGGVVVNHPNMSLVKNKKKIQRNKKYFEVDQHLEL